jgi:hypothetical protein
MWLMSQSWPPLRAKRFMLTAHEEAGFIVFGSDLEPLGIPSPLIYCLRILECRRSLRSKFPNVVQR